MKRGQNLGRSLVFAMSLVMMSSCEDSPEGGSADAGTGGATGSGGSGSGTGGAGGATAATSGVPGSKALSAVTAAEKGQFCDWANGLWGGYGQAKMCGANGEATNAANQAECIAEFPSCAATVSQFEACNKKLAADPCNLIAIVLTAPECTPLQACQ